MINNMNIEKKTPEADSLLLCLVSPNYAKAVCESTPLQTIDISTQSGQVLCNVLKHYSHEFRLLGKADKISRSTLSSILPDDLKDYGAAVIAYADTKEGKERLLEILPTALVA